MPQSCKVLVMLYFHKVSKAFFKSKEAVLAEETIWFPLEKESQISSLSPIK